MNGIIAPLIIFIACLALLKDKKSASSLLLLIGSGGILVGGVLNIAFPLLFAEMFTNTQINYLNWTIALSFIAPFFAILFAIGFILHLKKYGRLLSSDGSDINNIKGIN